MGSKAGAKGGTTGGVRGNAGSRSTPAAVAGCPPPIDVVHAFGSCPDRVRDNMCLLSNQRVAYVVGSRVAVTDAEGGVSGSGGLTFLSTGLRVSRVSAVACSPDKRFIAVCFKAVDEPHMAYATVYHMPTQPRPSRVKTLSYERPKWQQQEQQQQKQQQQQREETSEGSRCGSNVASRGAGGSSRGSKRWTPAAATSALSLIHI